MLRVWVDDWQMTCCGEAFSVGARVTWTLSSQVDTEWLSLVLGARTASSITHVEDHHAEDFHADDQAPVTISATVAAIEAVQCDFAPRAGGCATWPVEGSASRLPVAYAPRWVPDDQPRRFVGWLVELEHEYTIPADPLARPRGHHRAAATS